MIINDLQSISDSSKVFIFQSEVELDQDQCLKIEYILSEFVVSWQSHGYDLNAHASVQYQRFIVVVVDSLSYQASGCSIDKLSHLIQNLSNDFKINFLARDVVYVENNSLKTIKLNEVKNLIEKELIDQNTIIFNPMIENYGDLKNNWQIPLSQSWLSKYLKEKIV